MPPQQSLVHGTPAPKLIPWPDFLEHPPSNQSNHHPVTGLKTENPAVSGISWGPHDLSTSRGVAFSNTWSGLNDLRRSRPNFAAQKFAALSGVAGRRRVRRLMLGWSRPATFPTRTSQENGAMSDHKKEDCGESQLVAKYCSFSEN